MGWKDVFKKGKPRIDPIKDLVLPKLKKGYWVDWDLKSWEVTACNFYDFGSGGKSFEWQLHSPEEIVYLELETDDEDFWSLGRKIPIGNLGPGIKEPIIEGGDPPPEINFEGTTYYLDESSSGHFYKDGEGPGREFLRWSYMDDSEEKLLDIEQWGEEDFEASIGQVVEEYQFTNILPNES